jgi:hypothetical protein
MAGSLSGMLILNRSHVCVVGMIFGWMQYSRRRTCRPTRHAGCFPDDLGDLQDLRLQQGKFLAALWILIGLHGLLFGSCHTWRNGGDHHPCASILGILGSTVWPGSDPDQHGGQLPAAFAS